MPPGAASDHGGKGIATTQGLVVDSRPISRWYGSRSSSSYIYRLTICLDASADLKVALSEEYSNSVNFSNGEIFLKLRQYDNGTNKQIGTVLAEKRMWGRLSKDKRKDLKQIL